VLKLEDDRAATREGLSETGNKSQTGVGPN
jgi:hypothetical protein